MGFLATLFAIGILAAIAWTIVQHLNQLLATFRHRHIPGANLRESTARTNDADRKVAEAWEHALATTPQETTAILKARTPCALLLARSASNDLDLPTLEVVQIIRRHVPELVHGHCGVIRTLDPARRIVAIAEMIRDLTTIATMAQSRLDLITARRRQHPVYSATTVEFA